VATQEARIKAMLDLVGPDVFDLQSLARRAVNTQTGTTYSAALADRYKLITLSNASAITLTIPAQSSITWPTATLLWVVQYGAGQVTIAGAGGVTLRSTPGLKLADQYSMAQLLRMGSDDWLVYGRLSA
jgi:hypothetical protein